MKVLLLCMAFAAVSLAMPVAEQDVPIASPAVPEVKSEEVKKEVELQPAPIEEKIEPTPDVKTAEKPVEPAAAEAKNALPAEDVPTVNQEASAEAPLEDKKPEAPEAKAAPVSEVSESKPEDKSGEEAKSVEKPEIKAAPVEEITQAKVEEVAAKPAEKSDISDVNIDVVSAVKNDAAVADDVVDPAAINPVSDSQAVVASKSAIPEENKGEEEIPKPDVAKSSLPEEIKPVESKPEDKVAEAPAVSDAAPAVKAGDSDDASRVVRDAVDEKTVEEKTKIEAKAVAEVVKEEAESVESVKAEDAQPAVEKSAVVIEKNVDVKDGKSVETPVESPKIAEPVAVAPVEAADNKPEAKSNEQALGDAPAAKNSDESNESSEKNASGESSEESEEKPTKS